MRFSQRIGKTPIRQVMQIESIDDKLKIRIWNTIVDDYFNCLDNTTSRNMDSEASEHYLWIWKEFFGYMSDNIPKYGNQEYVYLKAFETKVKEWFFNAEWFEIYDFIETIAFLTEKTEYCKFIVICNEALEKEMSGYRIIGNKVTPITSEEEIKEIEYAITNTDKLKSVNIHLQTALEYLANREKPDYRNSIKESISAVESYCKIITKNDKATLGEALDGIERTHELHGALKTAFRAIYGYASDSGGIRHSMSEENLEVKMEDAKFMLVCCSAFINYLKVKTNS